MTDDLRKLNSTQKTYKAANLRKYGPGMLTPIAAGASGESAWVASTDFSSIVGVCFAATSASMLFPISGSTVGGKFFISGSDGLVYTYSASLDATASLAVLITSASAGSQFFITGSDSLVYTYSASMNSTASLAVVITSASLGAQFFITGSSNEGSLIYTYSASLNATASLAYTLTTGSSEDSFVLAPPSGYGYGIYTYIASVAPIPADSGNGFFFSTGSDVNEYTENIKEKINQSSSGSLWVSASAATSVLTLKAKAVGTDGNTMFFQSGSTATNFIGGDGVPADTANRIYYFNIGPLPIAINTITTNLKEEINNSTANTFITASSATNNLTLKSKTVGFDKNTIVFQSGSTQTLFTGGDVVHTDDPTNRIYYFDIGQGILYVNTVAANLKDEINNTTPNTFLTASVVANSLRLWTTSVGTAGNTIGFRSGSTQSLLTGGDGVPADDPTNRIFYFDNTSGSLIAQSVASLAAEINNSTANTFVTASSATNWLTLWTTLASSIGDAIGFQSGSVQESLVQSDSGAAGTLYIQQTLNTASVDFSGSAISIGDSSGVLFNQDLYSAWVRIKYTQTGSIAPNFLKIYSYLVP